MNESNLNIPLPSQVSVSEVTSIANNQSATSESEKSENVKLSSSKIAKPTALKFLTVSPTVPTARTGRLCNNVLKPAVPPNPVSNESGARGGEGGGGTMSTSSIRRISDEIARKRLTDLQEADENTFPDYGNGRNFYVRKMSSGSVLSDSSRKSDEFRKKRSSDASTSADSFSDYWKSDFEPRRASDASVVLTEDTDQFIIGDRVWVGGVKPGQIAYIGETQFAPGEWAGVVLDEPIGKNDGTVANIRYFQCEPKKGIFSRLTRLTRYPLVEGGAGEMTASRIESKRSNGNFLANVPKKTSLVLTSPVGSKTSVSKPPSPDSSVHPNIQVGDRVIVKSSQGSKAGILRYLGTTDFAAGEWCGVELDDPLGKNDGSVSGTRYFECRPQFGLFAPVHKVSKSPANKRPSQGNCAIHNRVGATAPGIRRQGSKESLVSLSSTASTTASIKSTSRKIGVRTPTTPTSAKNALQETLKEKELHIEQLLKERDLERAEVTRAASQADEAERRLVALRQEFEQQKEETEARVSDLDALACLLKSENEELKNLLEDERKKCEDLQFRFEEEAIEKADLKSMSAKYEEKIKMLENSLFEERKRTEALEQDSNKLFEAEEQMVIIKDELDSARDEMTELKKMRSILEQEHISLEAQLTSSRAEIESLKIENESFKSSASQDQGSLREKLAASLQIYEECKQEREKYKREVEQLSKNLETKDRDSSEKEKELHAKYLEKINEFTEKHQFEIRNHSRQLEDLKKISETKLKHLENELEEKIKICNHLEIQLDEVNILLSKASSEKSSEGNKPKKTAEKFEKLRESAEGVLKENKRLTEEMVKKEALVRERQKLEEELAECRKMLALESETVAKQAITLNGIVEMQNEKLEKFKTEIEFKSKECDLLKEALALGKEEEKKRLEERNAVIVGINSELEKLKKESVKQKEEEDLKSEQLKRLHETHEEGYKIKIKNLEGTAEDRRKEIEILSKDLENVKRTLAASESHLKSEQTNSKCLAQKISALEENFKMVLLEKDQMQLEAGDAARTLHSLKEKLGQVTNQKNKLESDISNFINSSNDSCLQLAKINEDLRSKEKEVDALREEILQKAQDFERAEQALKQTLKNQEAEMKASKEELEKIELDHRLEAATLRDQLADATARLKATDTEWNNMIENCKSDFESRVKRLEEEKMLMEKKEIENRVEYENDVKKLRSAQEELERKLLEAETGAVTCKNSLEKKIEDLIAERSNLLESFEKSRFEFLEKEKQMADKERKDAEVLARETEKLRKELEKTAQILATTVEELTEAKSEKNKLNEERSKLEETRATLEQLLKEWQVKYGEMEINVMSVESENQALKESMRQLREEKGVLDKYSTENKMRLTEIRSQLEALDHSKKAGEAENEERIRILKTEASELKTKFQNTETAYAIETSNKSKQIGDLKNEIDRIRQESGQMISEKEGEIENLKALVGGLRKELDDGKFEREKDGERMTEMEKQFQMVSEELQSEKEKREGYERRLNASVAEQIDLKEKLEERSKMLLDKVDLENRLAEVVQKLAEAEKKEQESAKSAKLEKETFEKVLETTKSLLSQRVSETAALKREVEVLQEGKLKLMKNNGTLVEELEKEKAELQKQLEEMKVKSGKEQNNLNTVGSSGYELQEEREFQKGQVDFLNSVIVDMQKKNDALKARIEILEMGFSPEDVDEFDLKNITTRSVAPRLFCDICDRFDLHDTEDCPTQASEDVPPPKSSKVKIPPPERPYCEICEAFGHDTADCDDGLTF